MAKIIKKEYILRNIKTGELVSACGMDKAQACANAGLKAHQYRVDTCNIEYEKITVRKHLTNAELIAILSQRDPNAEVDLMVDYSLWNASADYDEVTDADGVCFIEEHNQLVVNAGEFEC